MRFREGQCDYFGKKGMTLHIDVFLYRDDDGEIFTAFRSDQDYQDTLSLTDHVISQIAKDFPSIKEL